MHSSLNGEPALQHLSERSLLFLSFCYFGVEMRRPLLDFWVLPVHDYLIAFGRNCSANASNNGSVLKEILTLTLHI